MDAPAAATPTPTLSATPGATPGPDAGHARVLVVKLGALGDFVQALGPMQAIRAHHRDAHIALLTAGPFAGLGRASGCFDEVYVDTRPPLWDLPGWLRLRRWFRQGRFTRVYDLQTSDRSGAYFTLFRGLFAAPRFEWSGVARGCSHPHANPDRDRMHSLERQAEQLRMAGIPAVPAADLGFLDADIGRFGLGGKYVLFVPGGAPHRPEKRWPAARYGDLARRLAAAGTTPVLLGSAAEAPLAALIREACPEARDLTGATTLAEVAALARTAGAAIGNDTGPMHIIAGVGCSCVVLFSTDSDPALCAPRGRAVTIARCDPLAALGADEVAAALARLPGAGTGA